jgi:hypothetical protein
VRTAVWVVWLGWWAGLWSVFRHLFQAVGAVAILDFYQAAQNLYKGASAWLDGRTRACRSGRSGAVVTGASQDLTVWRRNERAFQPPSKAAMHTPIKSPGIKPSTSKITPLRLITQRISAPGIIGSLCSTGSKYMSLTMRR